MPQAGESSADRAKAHLRWADRYSRYGDTHKAAAHFGRALEYDRRQAFGVVEEGERAATADSEKQPASRLDKLPFNIRWKILTQDGCDRAIKETRDASIETRQGLYDTQMTKEIDRASLFVPEQCKLSSDLVEQYPNFTYRCSRFFQHCEERAGRSDARAMNLTNNTIREVLAQHYSAITNGTFYPPIGEWNVSRVTDMKDLFSGWYLFDSPLEKWDTSNVLDMAGMFSDCWNFNQPIGKWDTSRVTTMSRMFRNAGAFNRPIGEWKTGKVTNMTGMFEGAAAFQQDISSWDVHSVHEDYTVDMFTRATLPSHMRPHFTPAQLGALRTRAAVGTDLDQA
jgi:surface protein